MTKMERMAKAEFRKLPKKKQKMLNSLQRIPVAKAGHTFDKQSKPRQKHWSAEADIQAAGTLLFINSE